MALGFRIVIEGQMPTPGAGESRDAFLKRCIPMLIHEGRKQDQAVAICASKWREKKEADMDSGMDDKAKRPGSPNPGDYLIVEDRDKPTTWHLPYKDNGKVSRALCGAAWAALHGGYRGNKYSGPGKSEAIAKLRRIYSSQGWPLPSESKSSFTVYKTTDGTWRWLAIFSNKYRDNDSPPEILSEAAHLDFVKAVNEGSWPMPELWLWHFPESKWGTTELVAYDKAGGFSLAAGRVDEGMEPVAEALNSLPAEKVAVSHGMPTAEIRRDPDDPSILVRYRSKEISPLSWDAAANKLTSFIGATLMELEPKEAEEKLRTGWGEEAWQKISSVLNLKSKQAAEADLEYKETEEEEAVPSEEAKEETLAEADEEETKAEEAPVEPGESEDKEVDSYPKEELRETLLFIADQMKAQTDVIKAQEARIASLETAISALKEIAKSEEERIAKAAAWTTRAAQPSLREMIEGRVIGKEAARVDGRTTEAKDGPKETKPPDPFTGNPGMDTVFSDIRDIWKGNMVLGSALAPRHDQEA